MTDVQSDSLTWDGSQSGSTMKTMYSSATMRPFVVRHRRAGPRVVPTERDERYSRISTGALELRVDDVDLAPLIGVDRRGDASQHRVGHRRIDRNDAERLTAGTSARHLHAGDIDAGIAELPAV